MKEKLRDIVITDVCDALTVHSPKGRREEIRERKTYGLSFCTEGQISYYHNGEHFVSRPGYAVLLPQGQTYMLVGDREGSFPLINFTCTEPLCNTHVLIELAHEPSCLQEFGKLLECVLSQKENRLRRIELMYRILDRITAPAASPLTPAVNYVEQHYGDPTLTNERLARECCFSEVYFRRLFLEHFGITPKQYIISVRLNHARRLLESGEMKIQAVSQQCGFSNSYHFSRAFRQHVGMTPTEYRLENRTIRL